MPAMIKDTLQTFVNYLGAIDFLFLKDRMHGYKKNRAQFKQDFHRATIDEMAGDQIDAILDGLGVPSDKRSRFIGKDDNVYAPLTLYDFLLELQSIATKNKDKLDQFIQLIDKQDNSIKRLLDIISWTLIVAIVTLPTFFNMGGLTLIQSLLAVTFVIPVVGIVFTVGVAAYSFYQNITAKEKTFYDRFHDNFFLLASTALNIAAYSVLITAAVAMSPLAATLFVVAAGVDLVKEISSLIKLSVEIKQMGAISNDDSLDVRQEKTRMVNQRLKARNAVIIEMGSAALMVGIIAAWSFIPGGLFLSIAAVAAIGVVFMVKKLAASYNEKVMKAKLQDELTADERGFEKENAPKVEPESNVNKRKEDKPEPSERISKKQEVLHSKNDTTHSVSTLLTGHGVFHATDNKRLSESPPVFNSENQEPCSLDGAKRNPGS